MNHITDNEHQGNGTTPAASPAALPAADLAELITARVATGGYEQTLRAAVQLVCTPVLLRKIGRFVESDGWIDWIHLAGVLATGSPWSGGEQRLARLACSLSGQLAYLDMELADDDVHVPALHWWSLAECLTGLDTTSRTAALDAIYYAATGQPIGESMGRSMGGGSR